VKTLTIADIRDLNPCYDPGKYLTEDWSGTALDILELNKCPAKDRLWVVLREDFIDAKTLRLFAVWCARQAQHLMKDERSIRAIEIAERFAHGNATQEEMDAAMAAAQAAARDAAMDAAWDAARAAAMAAARNAAQAAAWAAAQAAARDAAMDAALSAARSAARDAAPFAARDTAMDAAWSAARAAQVEQLKRMLKEIEK
jgi:hypothetical protein